MKIEGMIRVEGVELHVDVEAPDGATHLYVTNVSKNTLVIPPERLALRILGFSKKVQEALEEKRVRTLAELVDERGNLRALDLKPKIRAEVERVLEGLRRAALVFDWKLKPAAVRDIPSFGELPLTLTGMPAMGRERSPAHDAPTEVLQQDVEEIEVLNKSHTRALRKKGIQTIQDLTALGEEGLLMVPGFDVPKVDQVRAWLKAKGVSLDGTPVVSPDNAASAGSATRQFLLQQGVQPAAPKRKSL